MVFGLPSVGEDLAGKGKDARFRIAPGFAAQARFPASLLEELLACEPMFNRDLRKKKAALRVQQNEKSVAPNLDGFGRDRRKLREQRDFDAEIAELVRLQGGKPWILHGCACSATNNRFSQGLLRFHDPNAALQAPAHVKGHENAATFPKDAFTRDRIRKFAVRYGFDHSGASQLQSFVAFCFREERHPGTFYELRAYEGAGVA